MNESQPDALEVMAGTEFLLAGAGPQRQPRKLNFVPGISAPGATRMLFRIKLAYMPLHVRLP
jgi:hypothetical protein